MEKVKVTKEQAEAIERWADKIQLVKAKLCGFLNHGEDESIAEMTDDELIEALYIGYEVEPEFKVGDWVILQNGKIGKIEWINYSKNLVSIYDCEVGVVCIDDIERHATPEEIAAEKERRWWAKHGRDVWELRPGDLLVSDIRVFKEVREVNNDSVTFVYENYVSMDRLKLYYKVVCFAEDRIDNTEKRVLKGDDK